METLKDLPPWWTPSKNRRDRRKQLGSESLTLGTMHSQKKSSRWKAYVMRRNKTRMATKVKARRRVKFPTATRNTWTSWRTMQTKKRQRKMNHRRKATFRASICHTSGVAPSFWSTSMAMQRMLDLQWSYLLSSKTCSRWVFSSSIVDWSFHFIGARARHGIPRIWSLRGRAWCRLDCSGRSKRLRLPDNRSRIAAQRNSTLWKIYWIWACVSSRILTWTECTSTNESIHVN